MTDPTDSPSRLRPMDLRPLANLHRPRRHRTMNVTRSTLGLLLLCGAAAAQSSAPIPSTLQFQTRLFDAASAPVQKLGLQLEFNLYELPVGGGPIYTETVVTDVVDGYLSVALGTNPSVGDLEAKTLADLGVSGQAGAGASKIKIESIAPPPKGEGAEMVEGSTDEVVAALMGKIKELGLL